jgi:hypothetical protein
LLVQAKHFGHIAQALGIFDLAIELRYRGPSPNLIERIEARLHLFAAKSGLRLGFRSVIGQK